MRARRCVPDSVQNCLATIISEGNVFILMKCNRFENMENHDLDIKNVISSKSILIVKVHEYEFRQR